MSIADLKRKVPPPTEPVHSGDWSQWHSILNEIVLKLPNELFELSRWYGTGFFVDGEFWLSIHSVFRPQFDLLVRYNDVVFRSLAAEQPDPYSHMFELGAYAMGEHPGDMNRIFWDTRDQPDKWMIGCSSTRQRFSLSLTDFLLRLFSNELAIAGFPSHFGEVRFEVNQWKSSDD